MTTYDMMQLPDAESKTGVIWQFAIHGAESEPIVRDVAIRLVRGVPHGDPVGRIRRLHEFVRDSIDYVREPVEMLHAPSVTLHFGAGDCDDHVILLGALAWSLKYPFAVRPIGAADNPSHYSAAIGYPESELPIGDAQTRWVHVETTIPALTGEPVELAETRLI